MPRLRTDDPTASLSTWGLGESGRVWIGGHNVPGKQALEAFLASSPNLERPAEGPIDIAFVVPLTADEAVYFAAKMRARLTPEGSVWIVYPRPGLGRTGEFNGSLDDVALNLFERGFVEIGRAGVSDEYSSLGFRTEPLVPGAQGGPLY
ncbi:MAG: hypothetical protein HY763_08765 [Planctomycetes bacterium]|nr:hypothetical protein [Planctomycetota bacterium]